MEFQTLVAEVDFNYNTDKDEFGDRDRIVSLNRFTSEEGQSVIGFTFMLGRKKGNSSLYDDTITLVLPYEEFIAKIKTLEPLK